MDLELLETGDGSHTLRRPDLKETYHSCKGALSESQHVFIDMGLLKLPPRQAPIKLLEIGWGTGLNSLLTAQAVRDHKVAAVAMTALEPHPIPIEMAIQINYPRFLPQPQQARTLFQRMHQAPWHRAIQLLPGFDFTKVMARIEDFQPPERQVDLIYFDAFGPAKQADVWCRENLAKLQASLVTGGCLVTYAAQSQFKRNLKSLGFRVECPPGFGGKREMTLAILE